MRRGRTRTIRRRRGAGTGTLLVVLGAWAALIPFVGPYFDFQIGTTSTWDWSIDRLWLSVLPGVAAVAGGLMMLWSRTRSTASFGGMLALTGGLWLLAGPTVSMLWNGGAPATGAAIGDNGTRVLEWLGFHYGVGALITMIAAYGVGFLAALPVVDEARPAREAHAPPAPAPTAAAAAGDERPAARPAGRRRGFLGRRRRTTGEPAERR